MYLLKFPGMLSLLQKTSFDTRQLYCRDGANLASDSTTVGHHLMFSEFFHVSPNPDKPEKNHHKVTKRAKFFRFF